jgi:hypothetical protein
MCGMGGMPQRQAQALQFCGEWLCRHCGLTCESSALRCRSMAVSNLSKVKMLHRTRR